MIRNSIVSPAACGGPVVTRCGDRTQISLSGFSKAMMMTSSSLAKAVIS
jgi:hypothetical protein